MNMRGLNIILLTLFGLGSILQGADATPETQQFYETKCGRCHRAIEPEEYTEKEWPHWVKSMRDKAGLTSEEVSLLTEYLTTESRQSETKSTGTAPHLGGYLYTEYFQTNEKTSNFDIHYLAVMLSGWAGENISYFAEFELEHGGKDDNTFVEQAYLDYWLHPQLALKIGAFLPPFNRFDEMHDPLSNHLITRPQVSREIGVSAWKDVGVDLHGFAHLGDANLISFDLYTINGLGSGANLRKSRQYRDNNEDKAFGGRVSLLHADVIEIGGSAYIGAWDDAGEYDLMMVGAHLLINAPYVDVSAEYRDATSDNPASLADGEMSGYFVQLSRLINDKYRPVIRYGLLDYLDPGDQFGRDPGKGDMDLSELALGFSYYPYPSVAFKLEYSIFNEGDRIAKLDNNQIGLQAAVDF
jgi:Dihaem cytochrome c/Phosphate-selective porin O and P